MHKVVIVLRLVRKAAVPHWTAAFCICETIRLQGQENAPQPARRALRGGSGQKKASFPAQNGIPTACRAGKCPSTCAEGAPRLFRAEKGIFSGAEWDTTRLPGRKMPLNLRRRCSEAIPGRKRYHFRRRTGYHPPAKRITSLCTFRRSIFRSRRR